jgi:hypothetical protein
MAVFPFVQFDVPGALGIEDGRYLVRNPDGEGAAKGERKGDDVIVVSSLQAPPRRRKRARRRPADADTAPPADVPLTRATVVRATPLGERRASRGLEATDPAPLAAEEPDIWLDRMRRDPEARDAFAAEARTLLNHALHVRATAAMDPHVPQLGPETPTATRIGYGDGDELVAGRWTEAIEAPPDPAASSRRAEALRPQERLAAVLGGREEVPPYETLILRARLDLDNHRPRDAALQLEPAVSSLLAELGHSPQVEQGEEREDVALLQAQTKALANIRDEALTRTPNADSIALLTQTLEVAERVLRRRRILGGAP